MADEGKSPMNKKLKMEGQIDSKKDINKTEESSAATSESLQLSEDGKPLSKRALKRMAKRENFHQWKMEKRAKERVKKKEKRKAMVQKGELGSKPTKKEMKRNCMTNSHCQIRVVFDSSFDGYMTEREVNSYVLQIQHAYASNRRAFNPLQFSVTGVSGGTESRLVSVGDYKGWDVYFHNDSYLEEFDKEDIVYLSSDSPNVLQTLDMEKVYIIGGLVDHNRHKGLCHRQAEDAGVAHARLPIEEYIKLQTRKVLACNHVFEILLRYTELQDWEKAFFCVIPKRKGAAEKDDEEEKQRGKNMEKSQEEEEEEEKAEDVEKEENNEEKEENNEEKKENIEEKKENNEEKKENNEEKEENNEEKVENNDEKEENNEEKEENIEEKKENNKDNEENNGQWKEDHDSTATDKNKDVAEDTDACKQCTTTDTESLVPENKQSC